MLRPLLALLALSALAAPGASAAVVFGDAHLAFPSSESAFSFFNATATAPESSGFRLFADTNRDGQVSEEEADDIEQQFADEAAGSMNGSNEDGETVLYDGKEPETFEVFQIESEGLVGPTTSPAPIHIFFTARATYDIDETAETHTIRIPIEEDMGNVPMRLTAPPGFIVTSLTGLVGAGTGVASVNGTSQAGEPVNATFGKPPPSSTQSNDNVPAPGALLALLAAVGVALARRQRRT